MTSLGLRWQSIVDFVVLVAAIYFVPRWSREARALRVTLGILALEAGALIARQVHLTITVSALHAGTAGTLVAAVILIVLFQPELGGWRWSSLAPRHATPLPSRSEPSSPSRSRSRVQGAAP